MRKNAASQQMPMPAHGDSRWGIRIGLIACVLVVVTQLPELLTYRRIHGMMHYPVLGRLAVMIIAALAAVLGGWASLSTVWRGIVQTDGRAGLLGLMGLALCLLPAPLAVLFLRIITAVFHVKFFWR